MLTNTEIKDLIFALLDCRKKLLWIISQKPINDIQRDFLEDARKILIKTNQMLEDFDVKLPI